MKGGGEVDEGAEYRVGLKPMTNLRKCEVYDPVSLINFIYMIVCDINIKLYLFIYSC